MPTTDRAMRSARAGPPAPDEGLRCRVRLADGRSFTGELPAHRHRSLQLGVLHEQTDGLVELAAGRRRDGALRLSTRKRSDHFLPGGRAGERSWLEDLLALAARHADRGEELLRRARRPPRRARQQGRRRSHPVAVGRRRPARPAPRPVGVPRRPAVPPARPDRRVGRRARVLEARPPARRHPPRSRATGEVVEPIERAHLRLIHHLGTDANGKPCVADQAVKDRSRVLRLAGTVNYKTGEYARILEADLRLPAYPIRTLVGDLPDPAPRTPPGHDKRAGRSTEHDGPVQADQPAGVLRTAGRHRRAARRARVAVPAPWHADRHPSCSVGTDADSGLAVPLRRRAGRAARSTTSRPSCSAARTAPTCAATRSSAPAPMSPTSSATCTDPPKPERSTPVLDTITAPTPAPTGTAPAQPLAALKLANTRRTHVAADQGPAAPARAHARRARARPARAPARLPAVRGAAVGARLRPRPAAHAQRACDPRQRAQPRQRARRAHTAPTAMARRPARVTMTTRPRRRTRSSSSASATRSTRRWPATTAAQYTSPPQSAEQARSLVALLLGCTTGAVDGRHSWALPIAGGRRTITVTPA